VARAIEQIQSGFESWAAATWGPMRFGMFRALWAATVASYFGAVIQTVGAAWQMTTLGVGADWVAFVQAASLAPIVLFALPAGALADIGDRRALMLVAQVLGAAASLTLVVVALTSAVSPAMLLMFTLLIGCAAALAQPAWQAAVGDLVDRERLPAAIALNALGFNAARSLGPAIGGAVVAAIGAVGAFALNALSYFGLIGVLLFWKAPRPVEALPPEPIGRAIMSGLRYAMLSPPLVALFARGALFGLCASSVLALLPLIARDSLGGGPLTYGLLLGGFGVGSMAAALMTARARQLTTAQRLVGACTATYAAMSALLALSPFLAFSVLVLAIAGGAWILVLATIGTCVQMSCPRWVVGRCVAMGQVATIGGLAGGSALWGVVAAHVGVQATLLISAGVLAATLLIARALPVTDPQDADWSAAPHQVTPPHAGIDGRAGPIVVTIAYRIPEAQAEAFLRAIHAVGRVRQRDGARRWSIAQDLDDPEIWRERYQSPTWTEHLRRVSRVTAVDMIVRDSVLQFHQGPPPQMTRMVERPPGAAPLGQD
jgi:MFS family permease